MRPAKPPLIELRQYIIAPGKRERMIELFNMHFARAQDDLGLPILGFFRAANDPDRLVWLRGLPDMQTRPTLLGAFYGGPAWSAFGAEAIGYVTGYDNVQLLRETTSGSGISVDLDRRLGHDGNIAATTYRLREAPDDAFLAASAKVLPAIGLLGSYVTEPTPNNFPALPIREGEHLFTWCAESTDAEIDEHALEPFLAGPPERLILESAAA
jgi:hypothetical protein